MKIAIYGQFYHEHSEVYFGQLFDALLRQGVDDIYLQKRFFKEAAKQDSLAAILDRFKSFEQLDDSFDLFFSMGGDGTFLKAVTYIKDLNIPIAGINTGKLGFLAGIPKESIADSVGQILDGAYSVSERSLLTVEADSGFEKLQQENFALNEVSIIRRHITSMIKVEARVDGEYLASYWSDGLVVSTPTGSTGYSLSCGGPVLVPGSANFIITPIAPHNLNARPIVIPDSTVIELKVTSREGKYLLTLDSRTVTLDNKTLITVRKAPFNIKMIQLRDSFIKTLRKKLLWGEDKRN